MITALGTGIGREDFDLGEAALPPHHHHDRRRRGRLAHPHAAADVLLPADARADRARLRLHRAAAAVPGQARPQRVRSSATSARWRRGCCGAPAESRVLVLRDGTRDHRRRARARLEKLVAFRKIPADRRAPRTVARRSSWRCSSAARTTARSSRSRPRPGARRRAAHAGRLGQRAARRGEPGAQPGHRGSLRRLPDGITASTWTSSAPASSGRWRPATTTSTASRRR